MATQRELIRAKSNGVCWYCGLHLPEKGWHIDHFEPVLRTTTYKSKSNDFGKIPSSIKKLIGSGMQKPQNHTLDNMVPSCAPCNLFKSVLSIEEFRREISLQVNRARKTSVNFRTAERFGLIKEITQPVVFWFEQN